MTKMKFALAIVFATVAIAGAGAFQGTGKKGYIIAQVEVTNPQQYAEYAKLTPALIEKAGGHFIARGGRTATLEGPAAPSRVVIIEFPSFERAQEFFNSPGYVAARKLREGAATAQFVLIESF